jgi:hypothetical protein
MVDVLHFGQRPHANRPQNGSTAANAYIDRLAYDLPRDHGAYRARCLAIGLFTDAFEASLVHEQDGWRSTIAGEKTGYLGFELFLKAASDAGSFFGWLGRGFTLLQLASDSSR